MTSREDGRREAERRFGKPPGPGKTDDQQQQQDRAAGRAEAAKRFGTTTTERNDR